MTGTLLLAAALAAPGAAADFIGRLEVLYGEAEGAPLETVYRLKVDGGPLLRLRLAETPDPPLATGQRVRVTALQPFGSSGPLDVLSIAAEDAVRYGLLQAAGPAGVDERRLVGVALSYRDAPSYVGAAELLGTLREVAEFYRKASYGRLNFTVEAREASLDADFPREADGECDTSALKQAASALGFDGDEKTHIFVSVTGCRRAWGEYNGRYIFGGVPIHELGHNLGMNHANKLYCYDKDGKAITMAEKLTCSLKGVRENRCADYCMTYEYADPYDPMGRGNGDFNGYHKLRAGWFDAEQTLEVASDGVFTLRAVGVAGGLHLLRLKRGFMDAYLEYRAAAGSDSIGATVKQVRVLFHQNAVYSYTADSHLSVSLGQGERVFFPHDANGREAPVWIVVRSTSAESASVQVHFGRDEPAAPPAPPRLYSLPWDADAAGAGPHTLEVRAYDGQALIAAGSVEVTVQGEGVPSVVLVSPHDGASAGGEVGVAAEVCEDGAPAARVELFDGDLRVGAMTPAP